jgi:hypothetical protein
VVIKNARGCGLMTRVSKLLNNFNTIQDSLVEVASTTYVDIIEENSFQEKNTNKNTNK